MPDVAKRHRRGSSLPSEVSRLRRLLLLEPEARDEASARLAELLYGPDAAASLLACDVLAQLGGPAQVLPLVETVLWSDPDGGELQRELRIAALEGLRAGALDDDTVVSTFLAASRDPDPEIAWLAAAALGDCRANAARASRALVPCLEHDDGRVRRAARRSLTRLAATRAA